MRSDLKVMHGQYSRNDFQKGQVLLIIVLVMIVALTIGLSVVTRSVTNLQISSEEESSQRALSAAEAGIERALQSNSGSDDRISFDNNSNIEKVTVNQISGTEFLVDNGNVVLKDDAADVWLAKNDSTPKYGVPYNGNVTIYWGSKNDACINGPSNTAAAIEVLLISNKTGGGMQLRTFPYDHCDNPSFNRAASNNFCTVGEISAACPTAMKDQTTAIKGKNFQYNVTLSVQNGVLVRVVPLYAPTSIGIKGSTTLPSQGRVIESLGASGNTQRKISVYKGFAKVPVEFFPYVLFSP